MRTFMYYRRIKPKAVADIRHFRWLASRDLFDKVMSYTAYGS